jgi:hypothetical protein
MQREKNWEGQQLTKTVISEIKREMQVQIVRIWHPSSIGTCDSRSDRANVFLDNDHLIEEITIG